MKVTIEPASAYFVHVPKTGGTSLGRLLQDSYLPWQYLRLSPRNMRRIRQEEIGKFRFYHSVHQGRTMMEMTGRTDLVCFTMLRDPVERTCSQIRHHQRLVREFPHTFTKEFVDAVAPVLDADLVACLDHSALAGACDSQIRTLGVREDYTPLFAGSPDVESGRTILRPYDLPPLMDVSDRKALLANSIAWIDDMEVVGLMEEYEKSVLMICDLLGIPCPERLPKLNTNPNHAGARSKYRSALSPAERARLEEMTALDRALYEHASERFREQWDRYQARPRRRYSIGAYLRQPVVRNLRPHINSAARLARLSMSRFKG